MRLLQILLSQAEAGAETYFEKVAAAFAQDADVQQRLIIESLPSREARLSQAGVEFDTLPMGPFSKRLLYRRRLRQAAFEFKPDVIFTWVNRASRKCPQTGAVIVGRMGGYYGLSNYSRCDHLIVNTPDLVNHVTNHQWPEDKVSLISNFGELPETLEVPEPLPEIPEHHKVVLTLGRLHPKKAHDTLIRALPLMPNVTVLIAGIGKLYAELQSLAHELGVADRVKLLGLRKDVHALFQRADVCVFPSRYEPLGNVILEAWATETPVVSAASQGPSWLIEHEKNGLLFAVDDHEACAREVNRVIEDELLQQKLKTNGLNKFKQQHSMDVIVGQYKELFSELVQKHSLSDSSNFSPARFKAG